MIYLKKVINQDLERTPTFNIEAIRLFFNMSDLQNGQSRNIPILINNLEQSTTREIITISKRQTRDEYRVFLGNILSNLHASEGDILVFKKQGREYHLDFINQVNPSYSHYNVLFEGIANHQLIISDIDENLVEIQNFNIDSYSKIFYGSPGTGKSFYLDQYCEGAKISKVTFHPEYDYHAFVGSYKPTMNANAITYSFTPQVFTSVYINAWQNPSTVYFLQIEEINRGNCAEIFGDLFQLLDRDDSGYSQYAISPDQDLLTYLKQKLGDDHLGVANDMIRLPNNLLFVATMNTSDQSLYPMDSAFKRRWDWQYMPINYTCQYSDVNIILDNGASFKWLDFLQKINTIIYQETQTTDKQLGNWFLKAKKHDSTQDKYISQKDFINKVIFFLWNDVFKDEDSELFKDQSNNAITFNTFFELSASSQTDLVEYLLTKLEVETGNTTSNSTEEAQED